jgi:hypothetical protein
MPPYGNETADDRKKAASATDAAFSINLMMLND